MEQNNERRWRESAEGEENSPTQSMKAIEGCLHLVQSLGGMGRTASQVTKFGEGGDTLDNLIRYMPCDCRDKDLIECEE